MPAAKLTSKGQLVVPKSIRDRMGLHPGDRLDFVVLDDGNVLMRSATEDVSLLKGFLRRPGRAPVSVEEMNRIIRQRGARGR
jgi:AbrB family looped-hinge helix DNA binding protein